MNKFFLRSMLWVLLFAIAINLVNFSSVKADDSLVRKSLEYLASNQNIDGGIHEQDQGDSGDIQSDWSVIAFSSSGIDSGTVLQSSSPSLIEYVAKRACTYTATTDIERALIALNSSKFDLSSLECDLKTKLLSEVNLETGEIGDGLVSTIFGIFAFKSSTLEIPLQSASYILTAQGPSGGWDSGWGVESNITSQALQALALTETDLDSEPVALAKSYLKSLQEDNGGIKYSSDPWVSNADAFSDAYVLQAIYALGELPSDSYWLQGENSIVSHLKSLQKEDGSFRFSQDPWGDSTPVWTTAIVAPSLNQKPYPVMGAILGSFRVDPPKRDDPIATPATSPTQTISPSIVATTNSATEEVRTKSDMHSNDKKITTEKYAATEPAKVQSDQIEENLTNDDTLSPIVLSDTDKNTDDDASLIFLIVGLIAGILVLIISRKIGLISFALIFSLSYQVAYASENRVGLLVRHSNGEQKTYCLAGDLYPISSEMLFKLGSIQYSFDRGFLVSVDGENALSAWEPGSDNEYWSHWINEGNGLRYANYGAQTKFIKSGSVDAWQIGSSQKLLEDIPFNQICPSEQAPTSSSKTEDIERKGESIVASSNPKEVSRSNISVSQPSPTETSRIVNSPSADPPPLAVESPIGEVKGSYENRKNKKAYIYLLVGFLSPILAVSVRKLLNQNSEKNRR